MDVVVVGSCMIDLISYVPRLPKPGETLFAKKFEIGFGGKGANQCIAARKLGANCGMVAKIGDDTFGPAYIENFKKYGIITDYVTKAENTPTGTAPIAVDEAGQNSIIVALGANLCLSKEDILNAEPLIKQAKVVVCQLEIDPDVTLEAIKLAKKHNVITIVNPAPANESLNKDIYHYADYFCPNETEAEILTERTVATVEDAKAAALLLLDRGCPNVIITLGENGSIFTNGQMKSTVHIPARKTEVLDSTGAGDAYIGALAYYLACHPQLKIETVLQRAGEIATRSVQAPGTQSSYAARESLPSDLFS